MVPPGYERLVLEHALAVARSEDADAVRRALVGPDGAGRTLREFAAGQAGARRLLGREPVYVVTLPAHTERVVMRHNRHGGALGAVRGDRFLWPTRAPHELAMSVELARRGVPTPVIVAYAVYPPRALLQRADVCSREIVDAEDLGGVVMRAEAATRQRGLALAAGIVAALARARARHRDLNAKNILIDANRAYVLDVDRVSLGVSPRAALDANITRLTRSLVKWRLERGAAVTAAEIDTLVRDARSALSEDAVAS